MKEHDFKVNRPRRGHATAVRVLPLQSELCVPPSLSLSLQSKWPRNNAEVEGESEAS